MKAEPRSRRQFEAEMQRAIPSLDELFKIFARYEKGARYAGNYVREDVQDLWEGWEMHRQWQDYESKSRRPSLQPRRNLA